MDVLFQKAHVTGASASCPGDMSSDECSDDDVVMISNIVMPCIIDFKCHIQATVCGGVDTTLRVFDEMPLQAQPPLV
jgi:hypothetical protein